MKKEPDGCMLTGTFGGLSILSFGIVLGLTNNVLLALIPFVIFIIIAGVCAGGRSDTP